MKLEKFLPAKNPKTIRRLRELEHKAGSLPILFALFLQEFLKQMLQFMDIPVPNFMRMLMAAILIGGLYVYDEERRKATEAATDKVGEAKDKAKEKVSQKRQASLDEYRESN